MEIRGKRVLVTGAGGFIGSNLTKRLVSAGAEVKAFVRYNSRNDHGLLEYLPDDVKESLRVFAGDLTDSDTVKEAMRDVDLVFHLGALISIPYSYIHPREVVEANIMGTLNVLNSARDKGIMKIVHTSTSEVYGTALYVPIDEKHPLQGQSPYSASKIGADKIVESFHRSYGLPVATIRPFNTYGPGQSARAVIPTIIIQSLTQDEIRLGSLHPTRDLTFVDDTVEAFIKVAESEKAVGNVVNIGNNSEISIGNLVEMITTIIGKKTKIVSVSERIRPEESEVERLLADNAKAKEYAGWEPSITLQEGLKRTIRWVEDNLERYKAGVYNV